MRLTALIPAFNDGYTLALCLASIVEHFDEIVVLDDASTDETPDVAADCARRHAHVRLVRHEGRQLGWVEARNRLLAQTHGTHLFWIDADDVLCEYAAGLLGEIACGPRPLVRLQLCEMWGDLDHTTQRLRHFDRCHVYLNRRLYRDAVWGGVAGARLGERACEACGVPAAPLVAAQSDGPLLFHLKGVKPDWRLVQRARMRAWLRDPERPRRLGERADLRDLSPEAVHAQAVSILLHSRQDHLLATCWGDGLANAPVRPAAILSHLPGRFQIVYTGNVPTDRTDRGEAAEAAPGRAFEGTSTGH